MSLLRRVCLLLCCCQEDVMLGCASLVVAELAWCLRFDWLANDAAVRACYHFLRLFHRGEDILCGVELSR